MSCSLNFPIPKALPSLSRASSSLPSLSISSKYMTFQNEKPQKALVAECQKQTENNALKISNLAIPIGVLLATVEQPAFGVTGVNNQEDFLWVLTQLAIVAFGYFLVMPPIIMNWLRTRWYKRNLLEMYVQFMFVFVFFPGVLLWAPFLNFRKFPRDPSLKYPWSKPEDPSKVKNAYLKYPWASPEDYE
ncbi:NAD(P)H-quinone oxidoreductase subunit L [Dillenia turbinata]|uniref:NAD(P)H-quinone oxidoreductase subunit L n=1 Tax=Dillenia turbinata TaxID=194707 RepID=A0AAN8ZF68_9MAGN